MPRVGKFDYVGGGLVIDFEAMTALSPVRVPVGFSVPTWVDGHSLCIPNRRVTALGCASILMENRTI